MLIGSILGALGAGSAARGYNMVRGEQTNSARWSEEAFTGFVRSALLRYLAVAHFGRGRGDWEEAEHPTSWQAAVVKLVAGEQRDVRQIWSRAKDTPRDQLAGQIERLLGRCSERLLESFYPEAKRLFNGEIGGSSSTSSSIEAAPPPAHWQSDQRPRSFATEAHAANTCDAGGRSPGWTIWRAAGRSRRRAWHSARRSRWRRGWRCAWRRCWRRSWRHPRVDTWRQAVAPSFAI
jgi:hypothetical protein